MSSNDALILNDGSKANVNILRSIKIRSRCLILLAVMCGGSYFLLSTNKDTSFRFVEINHVFRQTDKKFAASNHSYTIYTEGCVIAGMLPLSKEVKQYVGYPNKMKPCPHANNSFLESNKTHIWVNKSNMKLYNVTSVKELSCCYQPFYRDNSVSNVYATDVDDRATYEKCIYFTDTIAVKDEFVRVVCIFQGKKEVYEQFYIFAPKKKLILHENARKAPRDRTYNVIMLGIDCVSRLNFHRTMPKTLDFIMKKGGVEMLGYNKVGDNSFPNLIPVLMGYSHNEIKNICYPHKQATFDFCPFIWNTFKDAGYYTAFGEDSSYLGTFNYLMDGFIRTPTDYYAHPFIHQAEKNVGRNRDWNAYLCMNDKFSFKVLLDYVENIIMTLKFDRLFAFFWEVTMSHDYLNYPMVMDDSYEKFLQRLDDANYLSESIIIFLSDHGIRWGDIRSTKQGRIEERLPFLYVLTPPSFRQNYSEAFRNLKLNGGRLTTPFDLHETLSDLANLENIKNETIINGRIKFNKKNRGISLFLPIPSNRTCEVAGIPENWCTCNKVNKIPADGKEAKEAAGQLIEHLNALLKNIPQCSKLTIAKIVDVKEVVSGSIKKDDKLREYMVVVQASPGDGVFEGLMRFQNRNWTLIGSGSRLNQYGEQSRCVFHRELKLYCYCI